VDGLDKYTCSCGAGFSGDHCETGIAEITIIETFSIRQTANSKPRLSVFSFTLPRFQTLARRSVHFIFI